MSDGPDIRYAVIHRPGPIWKPGEDFRNQDQELVRAHIEHYRQWLENGKLEIGGPFLVPDTGGMMIPVAGISKEDVEAFAAADPAIESGLLTYEIQPWLIGMNRH